jgi:hypothetical protein
MAAAVPPKAARASARACGGADSTAALPVLMPSTLRFLFCLAQAKCLARLTRMIDRSFPRTDAGKLGATKDVPDP